MHRMIVLADETLENFFDHEFAYSFKLSEKETEQQRSLGREIFDNLLATGAKLASSTGVSRPQLKSKLTDVSLTSSEMQATIDSIENTKLGDNKKDLVNKTSSDKEEHQDASEKQGDVKLAEEKKSTLPETEEDATAEKHVIGDSDMSDDDDDDEEEEEDLSPDVLEEVDRLLKEYDDDEDED